MTVTPFRTCIACVLFAVSTPFTGPLAAQARDTTPTRWTGSADANGNLLYGAASQRVLSAGVVASRIDERAEIRLEVQGSYGDSRRTDSPIRDVVVRTSSGRASLDIRPHDRITPFGFLSAASSLQQRFARRLNAGVGVKYTFWRPDSARAGFAEDASLSFALLAEDTRPLASSIVSGGTSRDASGTRARWSVRARFRRLLTPRLRLSHVTFYQPTAGDLPRYTLEANTVLGIPLRERLDFTITHRERLDSEATRRGAPSSRDGQLLFGVRAAFR